MAFHSDGLEVSARPTPAPEISRRRLPAFHGISDVLRAGGQRGGAGLEELGPGMVKFAVHRLM